MPKLIFILLIVAVQSVSAQEPADLFSRANCYNNESITYNYWDPAENRWVFSWHFKNDVRQHYVTPNPVATGTCVIGFNGSHMVNGLICEHYSTLDTRHAAVHGLLNVLFGEPNPDGDLTPGCGQGPWRTEGYHTTLIPGIGGITTRSFAHNCNARFDQFY
jgi:hypothetical protein